MSHTFTTTIRCSEPDIHPTSWCHGISFLPSRYEADQGSWKNVLVARSLDGTEYMAPFSRTQKRNNPCIVCEGLDEVRLRRAVDFAFGD